MSTVSCLNSLPGTNGLAALLADWRGRSAYIVDFVGPRAVPLGNNGDTLLRRVCAIVLEELQIRVTDRSADAEVLLVPPGGALLDRYRAPALLRQRLAEVPDLPLVLLPTSSWFQYDDPAEMFGRRSAPTLWISREARSDQHLRAAWGRSLASRQVTLAIDHDVVVSGHRHVPAVIRLGADPALERAAAGAGNRNRGAGGLLVARLEAEAGTMQSHPADSDAVGDFGTGALRRLGVAALRRSPAGVQHHLRRRTTRVRQAAANARMIQRVLSGGEARDAGLTEMTTAFDISDPTLASYSKYTEAISAASVVVTDRLHVALPAAILGTRTYLVEAGYHKLAGVYEQSLTQLPHLTFIRRST